MRFSLSAIIYIIIPALAVCMIMSESYAHRNAELKRVLIVSSYHAGYPLSDEETEGIRDVINTGNNRIELYIENLDAKRFNLKERFQAEKNLLKLKYDRSRPDIIIVLDDDAFDFMADVRNELFAGIPVVFAGINDLDKVANIRRMNITGVVENPDYRRTLDLALRIFPRTRTMTVISDETTTGRAHRDAVRGIVHEFDGKMSIVFLSLGDMSFREMKRKITSLGKGDAVFLLSHFTDRDGLTMTQNESMQYLLNGSKVPFFVITDTRVGSGTVGGCVVSGYAQGKRAGEIALRILRGTSPDDIPVDMSGSNRYVLDYRALDRFDVDFTDLPQETIFRNAPDLGYRYRYRYILVFISIVVPLVMIIIVLVVNVMMRRRAEKALKMIRDRYLLITKNMSDTIWMVDMNLRKMYLSPSIARICGYSIGELWGMSSRDYISPASFLAARNQLGGYVNHPRINDPAFQLSDKIEMEFMRKDGSMLLAETQINIMRDDSGNAIGFLGVGRDITERRAIENSFMESERRMREMLENIQLLTVMIDSGGRIIFCNDYFLKVCGWRREEVLNKSWFDIFSPPDSDEKEDMFSLLLADGTPLHYESVLVTREGKPRTILWNNTVMRDTRGGRIGITSIGIDITEKKIAETELRESERKFRMLIEQSIEGIVLVDDNGFIEEWNRAVEEITGMARSSVIGAVAWDVFFRLLPVRNQTAENQQRVKEMYDRFINGDDSFLNKPVETMILSENNEERNICLTIFPIVAETGGNRLGVIISDITARKKAENSIRSSLEEKEILLKEIHHRVKNNLQIISSLLHLQESYIRDRDDAEIFRDSRNRIKTMAMIHEKLYQSKEFSRLDFTSYVRSLGAGLFTAYGASVDRISLSIEIDDVSLDIDSSISCGLLINELLSNALKYAFPDGRRGTISVILRQTEGEYRLCVRDDGVGFPDDFSVNSAETLGLRLVRAMVDQLHGDMRVTKGENGGVEYDIRFRILTPGQGQQVV